MPFGKNILIEKDDFMESPDEDFYRLSPGAEVRLRYAYIIKCEEIIKDEDGEIIELICSYDPDTKSGVGKSKKKVKSATTGFCRPLDYRKSEPLETLTQILALTLIAH